MSAFEKIGPCSSPPRTFTAIWPTRCSHSRAFTCSRGSGITSFGATAYWLECGPRAALARNEREADSGQRTREDDDERPHTPPRQQEKSNHRRRDVRRRLDRTRPHRIIERCPEQSHDGGIDAADARLRGRARAQCLPER